MWHYLPPGGEHLCLNMYRILVVGKSLNIILTSTAAPAQPLFEYYFRTLFYDMSYGYSKAIQKASRLFLYTVCTSVLPPRLFRYAASLNKRQHDRQ